MEIKFKRLSENAVAPVKAHNTDAGFDLTCSEITTELNECGQLILVYHTGLAIEIPEGWYGDIRPRSSIFKKPLRICNAPGTIDSGYRGEVTVKMAVTTDVVPSVYKVGERFAQLLILPVPEVTFTESEELTDTERGEGGYGSTDETNIEEQSAPMGPEGYPEQKSELTDQQTTNGVAAGQNGPEQAE